MDKLQSTEDYLEAILILSKKNANVRSIDIANELGFSKPSVSIALKKLKANGDIIMDESTSYITLTDQGYEIARYVLEKHETLSSFLISLGVDEATAYQDACKIEHCLSKQSFAKIKEFISNHNQN